MLPRIFQPDEFIQIADPDPILSVITESEESLIIVWHILPGQQIQPHTHPMGQDTWIILSGRGDYILDAQGTTQPIEAGQVIVAHTGEIHGVINSYSEPLQFISVVSPKNAGFQPL